MKWTLPADTREPAGRAAWRRGTCSCREGRVTNPRGAAAKSAAMSAALSGAVDLSALKARADAARQQQSKPAAAQSADEQPGAVFEVTEATFQSEVVERSLHQLVVV